jgi:hypothetical protein
MDCTHLCLVHTHIYNMSGAESMEGVMSVCVEKTRMGESKTVCCVERQMMIRVCVCAYGLGIAPMY